jgi:hypothetical protein
MKYPSDWIKNENRANPNSLATFDSPLVNSSTATAHVQIGIWDSPPVQSLDGYLKYHIDRDKNTITAFQVVHSDTNSSLAGQSAYRMLSTVRDSITGLNDSSMELGTFFGSKLYWITISAQANQFSNYIPTIQQMVNSYQVQNETGSVIKYQNPNLGFSIGYPSNWTLSERSNNVAFTPKSQGTPYANVGVNVTEINSSQNVSSQYNDNKLLELRNNLIGFHLIDENDTNFSGYPGHYFLFTFSANSSQLEGLTEYTLVGSRVYELRFISTIDNFDNLLNYLIPNMVSSFVIYQQQPAGPSSSNSLCVPGFHCE